MNEPSTPSVSVMITTRNRLEDLMRTCRELRRLAPPPLEILITADGCTDGTVEFVKSEMPGARLMVNEPAQGSVPSRDRMLRAARGELVLSIDDDSYPEQPDSLARIARLFARRPSLAVLHFPQHSDEYPETLSQTDFGAERPTRSFANSGAVFSRATYLRLDGFVPFFFHAYEEPDYALQCVAAGDEILFSPLVTIRHHFSGQMRNEIRVHQRHARNEFWSAMIRCPFPQCLAMAAYRVLSQFRYACKRGLGWVVREPSWWGQALAGIPQCLRRRRPVSWAGYKRWLELP